MRAVFSACGTYRYRLERDAPDETSGGPVAFVMLNPSTADADRDDPTIRRVRILARGFGFGPIVVANLYALRASDPRALAAHPDPVGPQNAAHLAALAREGRDVVCAWGVHADPARAAATIALLGRAGARLWHLGLTKAGAPRHPLYVPRDVPLTPLSPA
ncbi:DUF1643 domain-containing protein [Salinarimonas ramus]|uniref:DUF1643 domain-containing protein n=1 Tax=Salinarimonas ramus TaxID=690164 RepID=A0A917Q430_9HYPH|nr:DUF1643 domain-containing protein [Salinarimonas ramus]GGK18790.1 hypothetical protein GCM10011322_01870 [Salinarimonas ramus]